MRLLLAAAALFCSSGALAQVTPDPGPASPDVRAEARAKLLAADADRDGKWSKAEWTAAGRRERGFEMMDADKDGFISQAELKAGMARMQAMRAEKN